MLRLIDPVTEARFWVKADVRDPDECWPWLAQANADGRGLMSYRGRKVRATHIALMMVGKPRPPGHGALHSCDNPNCVNPSHLRWGTDQENIADKLARGRQSRKGGPRGVSHPNAKLSPAVAEEIRSSPLGYKALARRLGVHRTTIRQVRRGRTWKGDER